MAKEWKSTCKRFVAFFDIMGFKDMMFRNSHDYVMEKMDFIREVTELTEKEGKTLSRARKAGNQKSIEGVNLAKAVVLPVIFSDSILFVSEDDSRNSAYQILFEASFLLDRALLKGIPLKGALAYGKQTADFKRSLHFGRPLVDAFELEEELCLYGAILHHSMEEYLELHKMIDHLVGAEVLCKSKIPLKKCNVNHYCLTWSNASTYEPHEIVSRLYNTVSGSTRHYVDNTMEFINSIEANRPKK